MQTPHPRLFVVDDDRAVLSIAGTGLTCLDMLRALQNLSPECEAVLMTGYKNVDSAVEALRRSIRQVESPPAPEGAATEPAADAPTSLLAVERDHIARTLELARGNKAVAARLLGVSRRALYRQLERHGLHQRVPMTRIPDAGAERRP